MTLVALAAVSSFAQGTINPLNGALTRIKVDTNGDRVGDRNATAADGITFSVYWGAAGAAPENLAGTFSIGTTEGVLIGASSLALPGAGEAGTVVSLQIKASNQQGWYGETQVKQVTLTAPPPAAGAVIWTSGSADNRFSPLVVSVPEPSTIALGALGLGSLLLFRRRK